MIFTLVATYYLPSTSERPSQNSSDGIHARLLRRLKNSYFTATLQELRNSPKQSNARAGVARRSQLPLTDEGRYENVVTEREPTCVSSPMLVIELKDGLPFFHYETLAGSNLIPGGNFPSGSNILPDSNFPLDSSSNHRSAPGSNHHPLINNKEEIENIDVSGAD
jgi:hypothetical protein